TGRLPLAVALAAAACVEGAAGQDGGDPREAALRDARGAQARFERERVARLPIDHDWPGGGCDEVVGRICMRAPAGDWYPPPEDERIVQARETLLAELAAAGEDAPGDPWILGQRVFYLGEAGRWEEALALVRPDACTDADPCRVLE